MDSQVDRTADGMPSPFVVRREYTVRRKCHAYDENPAAKEPLCPLTQPTFKFDNNMVAGDMRLCARQIQRYYQAECYNQLKDVSNRKTWLVLSSNRPFSWVLRRGASGSPPGTDYHNHLPTDSSKTFPLWSEYGWALDKVRATTESRRAPRATLSLEPCMRHLASCPEPQQHTESLLEMTCERLENPAPLNQQILNTLEPNTPEEPIMTLRFTSATSGGLRGPSKAPATSIDRATTVPATRSAAALRASSTVEELIPRIMLCGPKYTPYSTCP
ncbi:hypothetical protein FPRO05_12112 [Fusarium proliferatum]|uniref:Uncharacterized protein n=1 Tax=Gibberella intermedia TaxID=948311 RepID=A0A365N501_GIBIN|nr:hypothetical protein FPRO05_12112 [Fusarium proliferatum]